MKNLLAVLAAVTLTGCALFEKDPVIVKPIFVDRPILQIADPDPVKQLPMTWVVITKENFEEKMKDFESKGQTFVVFALTPEGYQNLAISMAELRRYIQQQKAIIGVLKEYYEKPMGATTNK